MGQRNGQAVYETSSEAAAVEECMTALEHNFDTVVEMMTGFCESVRKMCK